MKLNRDNAQKSEILTVLMVSLLSLGSAPLLMSESYSWIRHTTSESAAQGVNSAWLAPLGFMSFGWSVIWATAAMGKCWPSFLYNRTLALQSPQSGKL